MIEDPARRAQAKTLELADELQCGLTRLGEVAKRLRIIRSPVWREFTASEATAIREEFQRIRAKKTPKPKLRTAYKRTPFRT